MKMKKKILNIVEINFHSNKIHASVIYFILDDYLSNDTCEK